MFAAQHGEGIFAQFCEVLGRVPAKALQDAFEECAEHEKLLGKSIAQPQPRTIGKHQVVTATATTIPKKTSPTRSRASNQCEPVLCTSITMVMVTPARRELLRRPSSPHRTTAQSTRKDVVPWQNAKQRKRKAECSADHGSQNAVARRGDGGAKVRLQHDDGADRSPVAVVQSESQRDPPAESSGQGSLGGVNQQPLAVPVQQALLGRSVNAAV